MKNLKLYTSHSEYQEPTDLPNVSYCLTENEVHLKPKPHDYSQDYLTFEALENGTFTFSTNPLYYSVDGGTTWTELPANTVTPTITAGSNILWKGSGLTIDSTSGIGKFVSTGTFNAKGNIMSLHFGDNFSEQTSLSGKDYAYERLFYSCTKMISAENLVLPATTLSVECYGYMFQGCTSLTTAPTLPATILEEWCYDHMFYYCTSLTTAPTLPATVLKFNCYRAMFYGCTNLNYIKALFITEPDSNYARDWVRNVAATGTFVKNSAATWDVTDVTDVDGIPTGWTVETASA